MIEHPLNDRIMSVGLDVVRNAEHIVLASGGASRAPAIHAAIQKLKCHTLVTDESAANVLLELCGTK